MGLSANILWHQTNYQYLVKILHEKMLRYSYSLEFCFSMYDKNGLAFPMVSMCDFPISEIAAYMGKYGNSILGLSSEWGKRNKFCPVWYCYDNSEIVAYIHRYYEMQLRNKENGNHGILFHILSYMKSVEGSLPSHRYKKYRFYDEREVRLVPDWKTIALLEKMEPILTSADYKEYKKKRGNSLLDVGVEFDWKDIKYIIVDKSAQVEKMRNLLKKLDCTNENILIFDSVQVKEDFIGIDHNVEEMAHEAAINQNMEYYVKVKDAILGLLDKDV